MKTTTKQHLREGAFSLLLALGLMAIAHAQTDEEPQKRVRVEIEVSENGKTSTTTQELSLDRTSINGQLDEMIEEIEMILEEAVSDIEETDLEIVIRRNMNGHERGRPHYRHRVLAIPDAPGLWDHEGSPRAFLGVVASQLDEGEAEELGVNEGARISQVVGGSAAADAGLQEGDVILSINNEATGDFSDVASAIRSHDPGEEVDIVVLRHEKQQTITAILGQQEHREMFMKHFDCDDKSWMHHGDMDFDFDFDYDENEKEERAFLGIEGRSMNDDQGVTIQKVFEGSTAEAMGLEEGDEIFKLNGEKVENIGDLIGVISELEPGDELKVEFERDGKKLKETSDLQSRAEHAGLFRDHRRHYGGHGKTYRIHLSEMDEDEIEEFSDKSGEELDAQNSLEFENFEISPNPTTGMFRVNLELENRGDLDVKVFDAKGQQVLQEQIKDFEGVYSNEFDLDDAEAGMYIISITQNGKGNVSRIIKH